MSKYTFVITSVSSNIKNVVVSDFQLPKYVGGFDREGFWDEFVKRHLSVRHNEVTIMTLILDLTRCHWSPKSSNWPGMKFTVTYDDGGTDKVFEINLRPGSTNIKDFGRGLGSGVWNWTSACLATGAIYEQFFRGPLKSECININGSCAEGRTQFQTLVQGFTDDDYKECVKSMSTWIKSINCQARSAEVEAKIHQAALQSINARTIGNSAFSMISVLKYITNQGFDVADQTRMK